MSPLASYLQAFWRKHGPDVVLIVALTAVSAFARWLTLELIEDGGDPLDNWFLVREWAYQTNLATARIDHHGARIGVHWVTWLVQKIFGSEPQYYFIPSYLVSNLCTILIYLLGRQVGGKTVGVVAALLLLESQIVGEASAQLRRGIFECFYALIVLNCLVRYVEAIGRTRTRWLLACAFATFVGYLTEVSFLFMVPGILLVMWRAGARWRELVLYMGALAVLFLLETAFYTFFTQYWHRLHVIYSFHLGRPTLVTHKFAYLFERFTKADDSVKKVFYPFFVIAPILLIWGRGQRDKVVIWPTLSFLFLMTFLVRRVFPLVTFTSNNDRYLLQAIPPAIVTISSALVIVARAGLQRLRAQSGRSLPPALASRLLWGGALCLIAGSGLKIWNQRAAARDPLERIRADYAILNDAYARELPIIAKVTSRKRGLIRARALHWVYKGFLSDDLLVKDGSLPNWSYTLIPAALDNNYHYLPASPRLNAARVRELRAEGCAVEARETGRGIEIRPRQKLPAHCKP